MTGTLVTATNGKACVPSKLSVSGCSQPLCGNTVHVVVTSPDFSPLGEAGNPDQCTSLGLHTLVNEIHVARYYLVQNKYT